jgi:hypothetical protein
VAEPPEYLCSQCQIVGKGECMWPEECDAPGPRAGLVPRLRTALTEAIKLLPDQAVDAVMAHLKEGDLE